jgi:hypothetical protein
MKFKCTHLHNISIIWGKRYMVNMCLHRKRQVWTDMSIIRQYAFKWGLAFMSFLLFNYSLRPGLYAMHASIYIFNFTNKIVNICITKYTLLETLDVVLSNSIIYVLFNLYYILRIDGPLICTWPIHRDGGSINHDPMSLIVLLGYYNLFPVCELTQQTLNIKDWHSDVIPVI